MACRDLGFVDLWVAEGRVGFFLLFSFFSIVAVPHTWFYR